jgi:hypothetical protein
MPLNRLRHVPLEASQCIFPARKIGGPGLRPVGVQCRVGQRGPERLEWRSAYTLFEGVKSAAGPG